MKPRLLYLSAYPARNSSGGSLLMHRHFSRLGDRYEVHGAHYDSPLPDEPNYHQLPPRPLYHRLAHTRFTHLIKGLDHSSPLFHPRRALTRLVDQVRPDAIVTVAEDTLYLATAAVARRSRLPLLTVFHDWAPGWFDNPEAWRPRAERAFRAVYQQSAFALCVCDELREALGPKSDSAVLHPIPDSAPLPDHEAAADFHALYAGAFQRLHAPEVKALCGAFARAGRARLLRVIGPDPGWPAEDARLLTANGFYHGFHKGASFQHLLLQASVHLVTSPFGRDYESYARFSFPSKIPEYCRFGRPILLWGPSYAASVRWARRTGGAFVVDDPNPDAVVTALETLRTSPALREELGAKARTLANTQFNPERLQGLFESALERVLRLAGSPRPASSACPPAPAN